MLGFTLLFAGFFSASLWLGERDYQQWLQEAAQYRQDRSKATATSPDCQLLTMQVYEHRKEGSPAPDDDAHLWLGLQDRSGQRYEVDTFGPQWDRLAVGDSVTATVWNGEVEEIRDSGGTAQMRTNPASQAKDKRLFLTGLEVLGCAASFGLCLGLSVFTWGCGRQEKQ